MPEHFKKMETPTQQKREPQDNSWTTPELKVSPAKNIHHFLSN
jgi:hypothetical protein